jgi:hypothetical protein
LNANAPAGSSPVSAAPAARTLPAATYEPPSPPPPTQNLAEKLKRSDDAKYFPQLKRF